MGRLKKRQLFFNTDMSVFLHGALTYKMSSKKFRLNSANYTTSRDRVCVKAQTVDKTKYRYRIIHKKPFKNRRIIARNAHDQTLYSLEVRILILKGTHSVKRMVS